MHPRKLPTHLYAHFPADAQAQQEMLDFMGRLKDSLEALADSLGEQAQKVLKEQGAIAMLELAAHDVRELRETVDWVDHNARMDPQAGQMVAIEQAARRSYKRWHSGARGTSMQPGDQYETHLVWAALSSREGEATTGDPGQD